MAWTSRAPVRSCSNRQTRRGRAGWRSGNRARRLAVGDALPELLAAHRHQRGAAPARFWGAVAAAALQLVARGRLRPGWSPAGVDRWWAGPLDEPDRRHLAQLAAAMPPRARAAPVPGSAPPQLPGADELVRWFLDAVADSLTGVPGSDQAGAGEVRISLRLEPTGADLACAGWRAVVQVHWPADPSLVADAAELWRGGHPAARTGALLAVRRAAAVWPPLASLLERPVPDAVALGDDEVSELLAGAAGRLAAAGVEVHWPAELSRELSVTVLVGAPRSPSPTSSALQPASVAGLAGVDLLARRWQLALGGHPLTEAELDQLAQARRPVVRLRDQWVLVDPALSGRARSPELTPLGGTDALAAVLAGEAEVAGETVPVAAAGWLERLRASIADPQPAAQPVAPPPGLAATLRDYQLRGLGWLARMTSLGLGACLADDMGLGKTVTLIALHLHRQAQGPGGPSLVVCPASLLGNWEREIIRFAPGVAVARFHGADRSAAGIGQLPDHGFLLTTYATMRRDPAVLGTRRWGLLVADEAQHMKNPYSRTARALRQLPAGARVALTGTPVENNLSELWAILDWTTPGLLGTLPAFRARFAGAVESGADPRAAQRLARLVRPFLLRRRKADPGIAPELPPKTETDQPVALTAEQAGLYEAVVRETMAQIRASGGMQRRGLVLKLLTSLKQICNHPAQYLRERQPQLAGRSGKLELLDELVDTVVAAGGAVLVFTQYVAMARLIGRHLASRGVPAPLLHGGTPVAERQRLVDGFQRGTAPVFLLSLKAAGTGLNLTGADHVIHYDRWWNPAVEQQATDRAHRIGQTRPVQVHRLLTEGTVEDRIAAMLRAKRELADAVLTGGEAALSELSDAELAGLVELRVREEVRS